MNKSLWLLGSGLLFALVPLACGDDTGTGGGTGGTGGATSAASTTKAVTVTQASASTGGAMCDGSAAVTPECAACLEDACCDVLADADNDVTNADVFDCAGSSCAECFGPLFPDPECNAPTTLPAAGACATNPNNECNPVTQEGCDVGSGAACDTPGGISQAGFVCYSSGNVKGLCESCGANADDFCQAGMTCGSSDGATVQCVKYCCVDADCGGSPCQTGVFLFDPGVGVCANGGAGGGGQGGAGGGGGAGGAGGS